MRIGCDWIVRLGIGVAAFIDKLTVLSNEVALTELVNTFFLLDERHFEEFAYSPYQNFEGGTGCFG